MIFGRYTRQFTRLEDKAENEGNIINWFKNEPYSICANGGIKENASFCTNSCYMAHPCVLFVPLLLQ